jgi:ABC-type cobalt transport system substrate-binding protein
MFFPLVGILVAEGDNCGAVNVIAEFKPNYQPWVALP